MAVVAGVLGIAAFLVLAELLVLLFEPRLPAYLHWHDHLTTGKWQQLRALQKGPPVDIVLAGSSQMNLALDPLIVGAPPLTCFNAGLYRGVPSAARPWLVDVVFPMTRPRLVVWGISNTDLNDDGELLRTARDRLEAAPARRADPVGRVLAWLRLHSALARRAPLVLTPRRAFWQLRHPGVRDEHATRLRELLGPMGKGLEFDASQEFRLSEKKSAFLRQQLVDNYRMGGEQLEELRAAALAAVAQGARIMFLEMPCTDEYVTMLPNGPDDVDAARSAISQLADEVGAVWVPLQEPLPKAWFADPVHLNGRGMERWSPQIAPVIRAALTGREP